MLAVAIRCLRRRWKPKNDFQWGFSLVVALGWSHSAVYDSMSDTDLIHYIYIILPLKEQFERDPYGLTQNELDLLNAHHRLTIELKKAGSEWPSDDP